MAKFQISLKHQWSDYGDEENKILKRAFMCGFPNCKFHLRGQDYEYDFKNMKQKNVTTGKERSIRAPYKWKQPQRPIVPPGLTTVVSVPPGGAGTTIKIPHPQDKDDHIEVAVPHNAKTGQAMLVPVPAKGRIGGGFRTGAGAHGAASHGQPPAPAPADAGGSSTGAKVAAAGAAGVVAAGAGVAVAAVAIPGAGDAMMDWGEGAADDIAGAAADAGDWLADAGGDAGDFLMDLF